MKNKKSVLIITLSTFMYDARVKTYATYLKEKGYEVFIVSSKEKKNDPKKIVNQFTNYRVITKYQGESSLSYIIYYVKFLLKSFIQISLLSFRHRFDIVHYNNAPNFIIFSCIIQKLLGAKIILDNHDIFPLVFSSKFKGNIIYRIALIEQKLSMNFADRILCADHNQFDYLVNEKIKKDKITVILNTPDPHFFQSKEKHNHERSNSNNDINMVYHGTISHRLGIDNVLKAINLKKNLLKNFKFHLIGTGDYLEEIKNQYSKLSLNNHVIIYNRNIPVEELGNYLKIMDIGIIANRITDISDYMLPVKLLEYVYCGITVIAPKNKIIGRYFNDDMIYFYQPENIEEMAEGILKLYSDEILRIRYSTRALKFSDEYNYNTEMDKYEEILKKLN